MDSCCCFFGLLRGQGVTPEEGLGSQCVLEVVPSDSPPLSSTEIQHLQVTLLSFFPFNTSSATIHNGHPQTHFLRLSLRSPDRLLPRRRVGGHGLCVGLHRVTFFFGFFRLSPEPALTESDTTTRPVPSQTTWPSRRSSACRTSRARWPRREPRWVTWCGCGTSCRTGRTSRRRGRSGCPQCAVSAEIRAGPGAMLMFCVGQSCKSGWAMSGPRRP